MNANDNLGLLIHQVATSLSRSSDELLQAKFRIGFSQFKILSVLEAKPNVRQKEIADQLGQTEASISRQIKNMYDNGLIQTRQRPDNRREHITSLTKRGERICAQANVLLNQHYQQVFAGLNQKQQTQLYLSLRSLM
jgi:DNA-binding MarR family transcriptional regulator